MSVIEVSVPGTGQRIAVSIPKRLTFDPPSLTVEQGRAALVMAIAQQIEPHLVRRPTVRSVVRDPGGRITGLREFEGDPPRAELALSAAKMIVAQLVPAEEQG